MSDFPTTARVVIIGGGVVGTSTLYHLAKAGWKDCVLLEKNELTAGSTWHAAGNVPNFAGSWAVMNMQRDGATMYRTLGEEVDYPMNYHVTGSIRLAHSKERMQRCWHGSLPRLANGYLHTRRAKGNAPLHGNTRSRGRFVGSIGRRY